MAQTPAPTADDGLDLSVVIAAYNARRWIPEQLEALVRQRWAGSWEVIVADNGSTDGTADLVERLARSEPRISLVDASQQRGAAHARNRGVAAARGRRIAFCDADDVVADGWVAAMGDALERSPFVTGPQEHEHLNPPWLHGVYGNVSARSLQTFEGIFPFGPTANLGIRRDVFERLGGFDESIADFEDMDLCLRAWLDGVVLEFVPAAVVHYRYRDSLRGLWRQAITYGAARPAIARRLSAAGRGTPARWRGLRNWAWLARQLLRLRTRSGRARWVVVAGGCVGRLVGSIRHRYFLP